MAWTSVGTVSITASLDEVVVGMVDLPPTGGLEVRIKQVSPAETSVFSAGRFFVRTTNGRTYGTRRFWGHIEGEDYQLGDAGYSSDEAQGELVIEPGRLNIRALKHPALSPWVLEVSVKAWQPAAGGGGGGGDGGGGTTPPTPPEPSLLFWHADDDYWVNYDGVQNSLPYAFMPPGEGRFVVYGLSGASTSDVWIYTRGATPVYDAVGRDNDINQKGRINTTTVASIEQVTYGGALTTVTHVTSATPYRFFRFGVQGGTLHVVRVSSVPVH